MIDSIQFSNFKSYKEAILPLAPLTLLIGANASGKTNAIEAIRFLTWLSHGRRLEDILESVRQNDLAIRGTVSSVVYDRARSRSLSFGCNLDKNSEWRHFNIQLRMQSESGGMRVENESLRSDYSTVPLYEIKSTADDYSHDVQVAYNNFARGGAKPLIGCSNRQAIFTQLDIPSRFANKKSQEQISPVVTALQHVLKEVIFLDTNPRAMTDYSFIVDKALRPDGSNLSSTLFDISETQGRKQEILDFIRALPEQDIIDIAFLETPRNEVMVQLVESFGNRDTPRDAPLLSDGTLRVLAIAAALLSAPKGSLVVIEEIDNGVHPSRAQLLLDGILQASKRRNLRVLVTTHNPALLDTLPKAAIADVVCCYRDPKQGDSRLVRLSTITDYPDLVARGPLGQLMTQGLIERYLKNQRTATEKVAQSRAWLKELKSIL
ncbi:AAA family ATPase [Hymenobacter cheonanensis]|uniref:AAA family ATPase n=1 Tax=Hymenobacter sp. CA2-7 TaxID=3063993 RepID=UPI00271293FF|nr:AAA family ATPase [Hymenobacter sp. CA2-7]MDO7884262.1 AAA family ATPase [Hymenobacter sp. CA2-7]